MSNIIDEYLMSRKDTSGRATKTKRAILEILENYHLTIGQITTEMHRRGFHNLQTVYNNINSFVEDKIVLENYINGEKYYESVLSNPSHNFNFSCHLYSTYDQRIRELKNKALYDLILNFGEINDFPVTSIKIIIEHGKRRGGYSSTSSESSNIIETPTLPKYVTPEETPKVEVITSTEKEVEEEKPIDETPADSSNQLAADKSNITQAYNPYTIETVEKILEEKEAKDDQIDDVESKETITKSFNQEDTNETIDKDNSNGQNLTDTNDSDIQSINSNPNEETTDKETNNIDSDNTKEEEKSYELSSEDNQEISASDNEEETTNDNSKEEQLLESKESIEEESNDTQNHSEEQSLESSEHNQEEDSKEEESNDTPKEEQSIESIKEQSNPITQDDPLNENTNVVSFKEEEQSIEEQTKDNESIDESSDSSEQPIDTPNITSIELELGIEKNEEIKSEESDSDEDEEDTNTIEEYKLDI